MDLWATHLGVHHSAVITRDVDRAITFWCDGLGLKQFLDQSFDGDWPTLLDAPGRTLRSVFLGDPGHAESGIVELVAFEGAPAAEPVPAGSPGLFLLSFVRPVEATLARLAELGFTERVRRITQPAGPSSDVQMATVLAPDGVLVELIEFPT